LKITPRLALDQTRRNLTLAEQACPHWDYESSGEGDRQSCCLALADAERKHKNALKRWRASTK